MIIYMSEENETVKQSNGTQSINADKTNLIGNISVRKPIRFNTSDIFNGYKEKETCNDFSGVSQEETKSKSDLSLDI